MILLSLSSKMNFEGSSELPLKITAFEAPPHKRYDLAD
jgi:hypothetical protein